MKSLRYKDSYWKVERNFRYINKYYIREKKLPFTDFLRTRVDLKEYNAYMIWLWLNYYMQVKSQLNIPQQRALEDYLEIFAYQQRKYIEKKEGRPLWGIGIGVRYVSMTKPLSPTLMREGLLSKLFTKSKIVDKFKLSRNEIVGIVMAGGPDKFLEAVDLAHTSWLQFTFDDMRLHTFGYADPDVKAMRKFWNSPYRKGIEKAIIDIYTHDSNIYWKSKRVEKWEKLALIRAKQDEDRAKNFTFFSFLKRSIFFIVNYVKRHQ